MPKTMKETCSRCGKSKFPGEIRHVDASGCAGSVPVCLSCIEKAEEREAAKQKELESCRRALSDDRPVDNAAHTGNKYKRTFKGVTLDVYDTIELWAVTCPARQHAIKKLLCAGIRGKNDTLADLRECRDALTRAIELQELRESGSDER